MSSDRAVPVDLEFIDFSEFLVMPAIGVILGERADVPDSVPVSDVAVIRALHPVSIDPRKAAGPSTRTFPAECLFLVPASRVHELPAPRENMLAFRRGDEMAVFLEA